MSRMPNQPQPISAVPNQVGQQVASAGGMQLQKMQLDQQAAAAQRQQELARQKMMQDQQQADQAYALGVNRLNLAAATTAGDLQSKAEYRDLLKQRADMESEDNRLAREQRREQWQQEYDLKKSVQDRTFALNQAQREMELKILMAEEEAAGPAAEALERVRLEKAELARRTYNADRERRGVGRDANREVRNVVRNIESALDGVDEATSNMSHNLAQNLSDTNFALKLGTYSEYEDPLSMDYGPGWQALSDTMHQTIGTLGGMMGMKLNAQEMSMLNALKADSWSTNPFTLGLGTGEAFSDPYRIKKDFDPKAEMVGRISKTIVESIPGIEGDLQDEQGNTRRYGEATLTGDFRKGMLQAAVRRFYGQMDKAPNDAATDKAWAELNNAAKIAEVNPLVLQRAIGMAARTTKSKYHAYSNLGIPQSWDNYSEDEAQREYQLVLNPGTDAETTTVMNGIDAWIANRFWGDKGNVEGILRAGASATGFEDLEAVRDAFSAQLDELNVDQYGLLMDERGDFLDQVGIDVDPTSALFDRLGELDRTQQDIESEQQLIDLDAPAEINRLKISQDAAVRRATIDAYRELIDTERGLAP